MKKTNSRKRKPTYLSFKMGKEVFAVSTLKVLEVQEKQYVTPVPESPDYIKGIINFRGDIVPVVCLRYKFELDLLAENQDYVIIIFDVVLSKKNCRIAAIADNVHDVISADSHDIKPLQNSGVKFNKEYLKGILKHGDDFILMLDIDKVFETDIL